MTERDERTRTVYRESACLFCGGTEMTGEHLLAAWLMRAAQRTRRPRINTVRQDRTTGDVEWTHGERQDVAEVACRACNNGWMARLDWSASSVLKPIVRNESAVTLDRATQRDVAGWAVKTAMVN